MLRVNFCNRTYSGRANHAEYRADSVRQRYTGYQRDDETKLDYAGARYYASRAGRFTSVDPLMASASTVNPQTFNRYTYALNNTYRYVDPTGMESTGDGWSAQDYFAATNEFMEELDAYKQFTANAQREAEKKQQQQQQTQQNQQQEQAPQQPDNRPNITDMVSPNYGVGRLSNGSLRFNVIGNGIIGHDGEHVLGDRNGSVVKAIDGLTGRVLTYYKQGDGSFSIYILLGDKQTVLVLKDVHNPSATVRHAPLTTGRSPAFLDRNGNPISRVSLHVNDQIGATGTWSGETNTGQVGLHFTFVKFEFIQQYRVNISKGIGSPLEYYINPCGSSSPVRCR